MKQSTNLFTRKGFVVFFALTAAITWAFAFPLIKLGFEAFQITNNDTAGKTLFAGTRFFLSGLFLILLAKTKKSPFFHKEKSSSSLGWLALLGLINTSFHYYFFYIGLSNCSGSKSAIFDALGTFLTIVFACIFFKDEHMTPSKIIGCILGFGGVLFINLGTKDTSIGAFTFWGDGMLFFSATCSAFGGILTRIVTKKINALWTTGISLASGGLLLVLAGIFMGGSFSTITPFGILILFLLILVSSVGFSLYNQLICYNPVGEITIFNSLIPIFGAILSCILLGETFYLRYLIAGGMVTTGVYIINRKKLKKMDKGYLN